MKPPPNFIKKPLYYLLVFFTTLILIKLIIPIVSCGKLYVSYKESLVELGKLTHIAVKKENKLQFKIGHSDSAYGTRDDNYEVEYSKDNTQNIWFQIINDDYEDVYNNVVIYLKFNESDLINKVEIDIPNSDTSWIKFKDGEFSNLVKREIKQKNLVQTNCLQFKFKKKGEYPFSCTIQADGYKPISYKKHLIVK
jgi:NADH:ubiquinone oxidoreductase subunit